MSGEFRQVFKPRLYVAVYANYDATGDLDR